MVVVLRFGLIAMFYSVLSQVLLVVFRYSYDDISVCKYMSLSSLMCVP